MAIKNTPYGAQWICEKQVTRNRGGRLVREKCSANGISESREKAQRDLGVHDRKEH